MLVRWLPTNQNPLLYSFLRTGDSVPDQLRKYFRDTGESRMREAIKEEGYDQFVPMEPTTHQQQANTFVAASSNLFAYTFPQLPQQAPPHPPQQQFQLVQPQQTQQQQQLIPQYPMTSTMTATMSTSTNGSGNVSRMSYSDRERQVKRRTKTGSIVRSILLTFRLYDMSKTTNQGNVIRCIMLIAVRRA